MQVLLALGALLAASLTGQHVCLKSAPLKNAECAVAPSYAIDAE
jgi:hypothetical protein